MESHHESIGRVVRLFTRMVWLGLVVSALGALAISLLPHRELTLAIPILACGFVMIAGGIAGRQRFLNLLHRRAGLQR